MLVLAIGVVAVFGMVSRISTANRSMAFQATALDAFARIAAEIRDAECVVAADNPQLITPGDIDPGIGTIIQGPPAPPRVWRDTPVPGSIIRYVGQFTTTDPPIEVAYYVTTDPTVTGGGMTSVPAFNIDVRVRQIMHDPIKDAPGLEEGYWIQVFPVKKICSARADLTARGEY